MFLLRINRVVIVLAPELRPVPRLKHLKSAVGERLVQVTSRLLILQVWMALCHILTLLYSREMVNNQGPRGQNKTRVDRSIVHKMTEDWIRVATEMVGVASDLVGSAADRRIAVTKGQMSEALETGLLKGVGGTKNKRRVVIETVQDETREAANAMAVDVIGIEMESRLCEMGERGVIGVLGTIVQGEEGPQRLSSLSLTRMREGVVTTGAEVDMIEGKSEAISDETTDVPAKGGLMSRRMETASARGVGSFKTAWMEGRPRYEAALHHTIFAFSKFVFAGRICLSTDILEDMKSWRGRTAARPI
jgi:hypothetical protein